MAARQSVIERNDTDTLWLVLMAIKAAGGDSADQALQTNIAIYIKTLDASIGGQLTTFSLGTFDVGTPWDTFQAGLVAALDELLQEYNWEDRTETYDGSSAWTSATSLGTAAKDLVNDFDGKVVAVP